jgi:hypothetical protein
VHGQQVWEHGANLLGYERQSPQQGPSHVSNGFFHPLEVAPEPTLQIGYDAVYLQPASWHSPDLMCICAVQSVRA